MQLLIDTPDQKLWAQNCRRPYEFRSPCPGTEFALMLYVADPVVSQEEQNSVSDELVAQGCRYAVCAGHACSTWDDSIDWAFISSDPDFSPPDDRKVMTTWHDDEPLEEIAWYFAFNTDFTSFEPTRFVLLVLGATAEQFAELVATVIAQFESS